MAGKLTAGQLSQVKDVILDVLSKPLPVLQQSTEPIVPSTQDEPVYADPYLKVLEERKIEIIKGGLNCILVKGRRGVNEINRTQQELNMINDEINNKKNWNTHKRVG